MTPNFRPLRIPELICRWAVVLAIMIASIQVSKTAAAQEASSPEAIAEHQKIKRLEQNMLTIQNLGEARKLVQAGEYIKAEERYKQALETASHSGKGLEIRNEAMRGLAHILTIQAGQAASKNDYGKARSLMEKALGYEPANASYQALYNKYRSKSLTVAERYPGNAVADENLQERVDKVRQLFRDGKSMINTGQYPRAESKYNEILEIDPYNQAAMKELQKITMLKRQAASLRREAFKVKAMADVSQNWNEIRLKKSTGQEAAIETTEMEVSNVNKIYDKLDNIRIPELNFTDVDVSDAVAYLQEKTRALDPTGEGVNFVLKTEATQQSTGGEDAPTDNTIRTITLDLRDMPVIKVLDFISQLTNLKYKVEEYAVYIFPANETSDVKVVRSFSVPPTFFGGKPLNATDQGGADVKAELENKGVKFPSGTSAAYLPKTAKLVVRNTLEQINLIEQLVAKESGETIQISIETKFIEFSEDKLKDFSANLRVSADTSIPSPFDVPVTSPGNPLQAGGVPFVPPIGVDANGDGSPDFNSVQGNAGKVRAGFGTALRNSGSLNTNQLDNLLRLGINRNPAQLGFSGVLGKNGFRFLLTALESNFGGDLMSSPKVTLINGQQSKIRVVREFYYPEEYDPPEVDVSTSGSGGTSISIVTVTPSNPTSFVSKDLGVTLQVKANATPDRRIDLELLPEVTEFQGFINYGENINSASTLDPGNVVQITTSENLKPVFSVRKVETKIQVIDGQTVVMAGFIRNDEQEITDRVPFLGDLPLVGRAFRSKTTQSVKRNLMLFVTARMINPDGTPKFLTEEEADVFGLNSQPKP